ncbi:L,D-transpeptidase family protein [Marinobacterium iners]|uniref:Murein L,D-transpeptidase YcbB/YkuD n=1 Tax=Marinobacterium iners DSM 11526 TaxID=1122198 RepID=A0A1H3YRM2_9GAMM|nr:L,D-transpeptidase family protein [Marinobacterium iners]SEA13738.1 Murein L,D-transpeptidase YcbB/YkuD [Marinobacterium iners DSM 11526]
MLRAVSPHLSALMLLCVIAMPLQAAESVEAHLQQLLQAGAAGELPATDRLDWPVLQSLYERSGGQLLWSNMRGEAKTVMQQELEHWIRASLQHGLDPSNYQYSRLQQPFSTGSAMSPEPVLNDLLLSDSFMRLARDLAGVTPSAEEHDRLWRFQPRTLDAVDLLLQASTAEEVETTLQALLPRSAEYQRLVEHYTQLLQRTDRETWVAPDLSMNGLLRTGASHSVVVGVRELLIRKELLNSAESSFEPQEVYTPLVVDAVRAFQQQQGLEPDGILGPATRAALQRSPEQQLQQVRVNLQRWRWLPRELGERYLLVRTGTYSMTLVEQDRAVQQYRIISGRPHRPTLSFESDVDHLIMHPPWTVPFRLAVEDLLPKQRKDPDYFARQQIEVLQKVDGSWQPVDPEGIDWESLSRRNFPYLLRQRPGPLNSLGRIRFGMSNPYSIYLHDTPQQTLFESTERAFSSGCIRVDEIEDLAQRLLGERSLEQALNTSRTHTLRLERPLPVYLVYLTVWMDEQQQGHYHPDVYGLDWQLQQALGPLPEVLDPKTEQGALAQTVLKQ